MENNGDSELKSRGSRPTKDVNKRKIGEDQSGVWGIKTFWATGVGSEAYGEGKGGTEERLRCTSEFCFICKLWKNEKI